VKCKAKGTLIEPKWTSPFWPLIFEDGLEYTPYVTDVLEFTETEIILEAGMNVNSIFAREDFKGNLLAIRLDASISYLFFIYFQNDFYTDCLWTICYVTGQFCYVTGH